MVFLSEYATVSSGTVSKAAFPAHVKEMHQYRDKGFEKEFEVSHANILCFLHKIYICPLMFIHHEHAFYSDYGHNGLITFPTTRLSGI